MSRMLKALRQLEQKAARESAEHGSAESIRHDGQEREPGVSNGAAQAAPAVANLPESYAGAPTAGNPKTVEVTAGEVTPPPTLVPPSVPVAAPPTSPSPKPLLRPAASTIGLPPTNQVVPRTQEPQPARPAEPAREVDPQPRADATREVEARRAAQPRPSDRPSAKTADTAAQRNPPGQSRVPASPRRAPSPDGQPVIDPPPAGRNQADSASPPVQETASRESEARPPVPHTDNPYLQQAFRDLHSDDQSAPYRVLASNLRQTQGEDAEACIHLIGPESAAEAADVAVRVALLLAQHADRGVLLVDADVTGRKLTRSLGADQRPGLIEVLNHSALWRQTVISVAPHGVSLIPAGRGVLNESSIGTSKQDPALFDEARQRYTYIVLVSSSGDERVTELAARSSTNYLVVGLGQTDRRQVARVVKRIGDLGGRMGGCVATNI